MVKKITNSPILLALVLACFFAVMLGGYFFYNHQFARISPLQIVYQVRNISADETQWSDTTAVLPGDVVEYLLLMHLDNTSPVALRTIGIRASLDPQVIYRENTIQSVALGINNESDQVNATQLFADGLVDELIAPGEFIDIRWQVKIGDSLYFNEQVAPTIESQTIIAATSYIPQKSITRLSVYSTDARVGAPSSISETMVNYNPKPIGMNPRMAYDAIGTGVVIAGTDLLGVESIYIDSLNQTIPMRIVSNELIQTAIPAGLSAGEHQMVLVAQNNVAVPNELAFTVLSTDNQPTATAATPNTGLYGKKRLIVLQGVGFNEDIRLSIVDDQNNAVAIEFVSIITGHVLAFEIPKIAERAVYTLYINNIPQKIFVTVE